MENNKYFLLILITSSAFGILLGIFTNKIDANLSEKENDLFSNNNDKDNKEKEKDSNEKIKENNEEEKEKEEEEENKDEEEKKGEIEKIQTEKDKKENEIKYKYKYTNDNKLRIAVAYGTDNKYIYPTIVSMTSLVDTAGKNTFYDIYIMHTPDFTQNSKNFLKTVEEKYPSKCTIIFFNMGNKYKGLSLNFRISTPAYYRLSLPNLLPDVDKIIWLDGDTLVFEDLTELIKLDMKDNVTMGFLDSQPDAIKSFGFKNATVLCSGVLLMNLKLLRKYDYPKKIEKFIQENKGKLTQQDQTIVNVVFQGRIAPLPPKYGIWAWGDKGAAKKHLDKQRPWLKYNEEEFFYAVEHPAILHYIWPKPFWRKKTPFDTEWWDYARKTGYYDDIYNKSPIPNIKWR